MPSASRSPQAPQDTDECRCDSSDLPEHDSSDRGPLLEDGGSSPAKEDITPDPEQDTAPAQEDNGATDEHEQPNTIFPSVAQAISAVKELQEVDRQARFGIIFWLLNLRENGVHLELGFSSFGQFCELEFEYRPSTANEYASIAGRLRNLPQLRTLFRQGDFSWEQVRTIARIATPETEAKWIEFAIENTVTKLVSEARLAKKAGSDAPLDRSHGLPNIRVPFTVQFTTEQKTRFLAALQLVGTNLCPPPEDGSGDSFTPQSILVAWTDAVLSGALPVAPIGPEDGQRTTAQPVSYAQTILYHTCPECRTTTVDTDDGPVSVPPERVEELEDVANHVEIAPDEELECDPLPDGEKDKPNSSRLSRQVIHRDGLRCANPGCNNRKNLHAHHIVFRANGGRTALSNEITVCNICHALIHDGLLEVTGSPDTGLKWQQRPADSAVELRDTEAFLAKARELQESTPIPETTESSPNSAPLPQPGPYPNADGDADPTDPAAEGYKRTVNDLSQWLSKQGWPRREARERVKWAIATLKREQAADPDHTGSTGLPDEADILLKLLRK